MHTLLAGYVAASRRLQILHGRLAPALASIRKEAEAALEVEVALLAEMLSGSLVWIEMGAAICREAVLEVPGWGGARADGLGFVGKARRLDSALWRVLELVLVRAGEIRTWLGVTDCREVR